MAALEDNVAFLEQWCEEQQDTLDRAVRQVACEYEIDAHPEPEVTPRALLRVVDLRDTAGPGGGDEADDAPIFAVVETEHERRVHQIRVHLNRLRTRLAASLAPGAATPVQAPPRPPAPRPVTAKPAGRTAP